MSNNNTATNGSIPFIRAVEEAFFLLDRNQDRLVNGEDFCAVASSAGIQLDPEEALTLIRSAIHEQTDDQTDESEMTVDQYSALMLRYVGSSELNDELRQTFDAFDNDHDGWITKKDLDVLRHDSSFFEQLDEDQYELVVQELLVQAKNDRGLDFNQFVNLMMHQ